MSTWDVYRFEFVGRSVVQLIADAAGHRGRGGRVAVLENAVREVTQDAVSRWADRRLHRGGSP
ncbi:MAG: hypothetical protein DWQ08_09600 [Proteobacteria bacterium]|nr:MAG: hypothetical protein DWQ08_09600 [Pseudomonadota bacterium]